MKNIAVFASGTGSNFLAILNAIEQGHIHANLSILISDRPKSKAIEKAKNLQIEFLALRPKSFDSKTKYEEKILETLHNKNIDLIVLAGYMRLIGNTLLSQYPKRILNIHPSLLPAFKGKDAVGQAINAKVDKTGVTVHYVDAGMDTGEIIEQVELDLSNLYTREDIEIQIHKIEHNLYPKVIQKVLEDILWEER